MNRLNSPDAHVILNKNMKKERKERKEIYVDLVQRYKERDLDLYIDSDADVGVGVGRDLDIVLN